MRPIRVVALAVAAAASVAPPAHAATVCGPTRARTIAADREARAYVQAGTLKACHRDGGRVRNLGPRDEALGVWVSGRRVAVRRARTTGERLTVSTLRGPTRAYHEDVDGTIEAVALERRGVAIYVERRPDGERRVGATRSAVSFAAQGVDPRSLWFRGGVAAWRDATSLHVFALLGGTRRVDTLARFGTLAITVRGGLVRYQRTGRPAVELDVPLTTCTSSQGCGGITRIQVAGRFLAAETVAQNPDGGYSYVSVHDTKGGRVRNECRDVRGDFRLAADGTVTCA